MSCKGEPIQVLLVEDNPGDAVLFNKCLKKSGRVSNVEVVYDGEEALQRLLGSTAPSSGTNPPQLVIMDLNLPRVSGQELLREIKSHEHLRSIPVIVLTSSEDESDVRSCYEAGANCVLIKATDFDGVTKLVRVIEDFWIDTVCFPSPGKEKING